MRVPTLVLLLAPALLAGCLQGGDDGDDGDVEVDRAFGVSSRAFPDGGAIPVRHSCDGENVSPPLTFRDLPLETRSLALIMDDPDAPRGTFVHWTFWNLPPTRLTLNEGADVAAYGATMGATSAGEPGYRGPCPPSGTHRYFFKAYAVDGDLDLDATATKADLVRALEGRTLARGELMGTFARAA